MPCLLSLKGTERLVQKGMGGKWGEAEHNRAPVLSNPLSHMAGCKMTYSPDNVGRTFSIDHAFQAHDAKAFWLMFTG